MQYSLLSLVILGIVFSSSLAKLVPTPGGLLPKECVHEVPSGSTLLERKGKTLEVITEDGKRLSFPACNLPKNNQKVRQDSGWNTYAESDGVNFNAFNCTWTVPAAPVQYTNQTLFYFNSFEDIGQDEIIQPVIQYGPSEAGGGKFWTIASWWVNSAGSALYSTLTKCNTGDAIFGTMVRTGQTANSTNWVISGYINGATPTTLKVTNTPLQQVATLTMEVYNVNGCKEYPNDAGITFTNFKIIDNGKPYTPTWMPTVDFSDCGEGVKFSNHNQTITLTY